MISLLDLRNNYSLTVSGANELLFSKRNPAKLKFRSEEQLAAGQLSHQAAVANNFGYSFFQSFQDLIGDQLKSDGLKFSYLCLSISFVILKTVIDSSAKPLNKLSMESSTLS